MSSPPKKLSARAWYNQNLQQGNQLTTDYSDIDEQIARGKYFHFYNPKQYKKSPEGGFVNIQYPDAKMGDENYGTPFIDYNAPVEANPKPAPVSVDPNHKPLVMGPYQNYNPNTNTYVDSKTQQKVDPVVNQLKKGGLVKKYLTGGEITQGSDLFDTAATAGSTLLSGSNNIDDNGQIDVNKAKWAGALGAAGKGAKAGAGIGSLFGPVGTLIGAGAGALGAGAFGMIKGKDAAEDANEEAIRLQKEKDDEERAAKGRLSVSSALAQRATENMSKGGKITGKGTAKSDSIPAKVDGFVVPAENSQLAETIRKYVLKENPNKKADLNQPGGSKVKLSNGEHLFTDEEVAEIGAKGIDLDDLAPEAKTKLRDEMNYAKGGRVGEDKFEAIRAEAEAELKKAYPGKDVKVIYKGEERSLDEQAAAQKKGSSTTKIGLHNVGGARDFNIIIDGRVLGNSKDDLKVYKDYVWKNAEKQGLYHLKEGEFGSTDPYHISLVEENGDGTAFSRLIQQHPEIADSDAYKNTLRQVKALKAQNPKDTTYDHFLDSEKVVNEMKGKSNSPSPKQQTFTENLQEAQKNAPKGLVDRAKVNVTETDPRAFDAAEDQAAMAKYPRVTPAPESKLAEKYLIDPKSDQIPNADAIKAYKEKRYLIDPSSDQIPTADQLYPKPAPPVVAEPAATASTNGLVSSEMAKLQPSIEGDAGEGAAPSTVPQPEQGDVIKGEAPTVDTAWNKKSPGSAVSDAAPKDWLGAASGILNYGLPLVQTYLGNKMLQKAGKRPIDKLDPEYQTSIDAARKNLAINEANAKFGYTAEEQAMINNQNAAATSQARASARNYSGGSAGNAYQMEMGAINDGFNRGLAAKVRDKQLELQKQGIAQNSRAYLDQLIAGNTNYKRMLYGDADRRWMDTQNAGAGLLNAGISNAVGADRYNAELEAQKQRDLKYGR
jgi:hypothetical protein